MARHHYFPTAPENDWGGVQRVNTLLFFFAFGEKINARALSISSDSTYAISSFHYPFILFSKAPMICQFIDEESTVGHFHPEIDL